MFSALLTCNLAGGHTALWLGPSGNGAQVGACCQGYNRTDRLSPKRSLFFPRGLITLGKQPRGYLQVT